MIDISIGLDGVPSINKITLGNQYENLDETIHFDLPQNFENHYKYLLSILRRQDEEPLVSVLPVVNNEVKVSSSLSYHYGAWSMYLMSRESELDLTQETIDISAVENEHVFISDAITGIVKKVAIEQDMVSSIPLDNNYKIYYEGFDSRLKALEQGFDLSKYALKSEIPTNYAETNHTHDEYLTEIPSEYVTNTELENRLEDFGQNTAIQADWNQHDEAADDYIKNKPFYYNKKVLLNITSEDYTSGNYTPINLVVGEKYNVLFNDMLFEDMVCFPDDDAGNSLNDPNFFYIGDKNGNGLFINGGLYPTYTIEVYQEELKKLDELFLEQSDWNNSDEYSGTYIKNRPFYSIDPVYEAISDEITVDVNTAWYGSNYYVQMNSGLGVRFSNEDVFTVVWDGVEYKDIPVGYYTSGRYPMNAIGNNCYETPLFTQYPFSVGYRYNNFNTELWVCAREAGTHTFKIFLQKVKSELKQLDEKYIPSTIARVEDIQAMIDAAIGVALNTEV